MKKIEILLHNKEKIILIAIPIDATDITPDKNAVESDYIQLYYTDGMGDINTIEPDKLFDELLGEYNPIKGEISFEVKEEWVELFAPHGYRDYSPKLMFVKTLKDSFLSLLKAETEKMWPLKENAYISEPTKVYKDWQESESKVMPKRFIVLHVK